MSDKSRSFFQGIIKYKGLFNLSEFYALIYSIMNNNGFIILDESHAQKEGETGTEVEVLWKFRKGIDDYSRFNITIYFLIKDAREAIIKKGSNETKTNEGNAYIKISGEIETDWQDKWEKTELLKKLRGFYERYFFVQTSRDYIERMFGIMAMIEGEIKGFLGMSN